MRVLLAEDTVVLAAQLHRALSEAGHAIDLAGDGEQALHLGATEPYDVAVLDLGLPRMDGLRVLRRWRDAGRTMPVLILTARDTEWQTDQCIDRLACCARGDLRGPKAAANGLLAGRSQRSSAWSLFLLSICALPL